MALVSRVRVGAAALLLSEREPDAVASSGDYYTMLESAPEVDPASGVSLAA